MPPKVFLINVGVNQSHRLRSPIFPDGRFEFVPIPEEMSTAFDPHGRASPVTYGQLHAYNSGLPLLEHFSERTRRAHFNRPVHYDPNLGNPADGPLARFSYGDVPRLNVRARNLLKAHPGDLLFFLANLAPFDPDEDKFTGQPRGFYVIAAMEIGQILEYPSSEGQLRDRQTGAVAPLERWATNAHVNRLLVQPGRFAGQPFSLFIPGEKARRFRKAAPVDTQLCEQGLLDKNGRRFAFAKFRSLAACVGAYTRTVRAQFDFARMQDRARYRRFITLLGEECAEFFYL